MRSVVFWGGSEEGGSVHREYDGRVSVVLVWVCIAVGLSARGPAGVWQDTYASNDFVLVLAVGIGAVY